MSYADVKKRFGLAIKTWRRKSGLSQEELAWRAGLHRSYVADIERGARNASLQTIEKLARALELSFSTLFEPFGDFPKTKNGNSSSDK
jgi:transcriptional regulator with XRE-family HTH domain